MKTAIYTFFVQRPHDSRGRLGQTQITRTTNGTLETPNSNTSNSTSHRYSVQYSSNLFLTVQEVVQSGPFTSLFRRQVNRSKAATKERARTHTHTHTHTHAQKPRSLDCVTLTHIFPQLAQRARPCRGCNAKLQMSPVLFVMPQQGATVLSVPLTCFARTGARGSPLHVWDTRVRRRRKVVPSRPINKVTFRFHKKAGGGKKKKEKKKKRVCRSQVTSRKSPIVGYLTSCGVSAQKPVQ